MEKLRSEAQNRNTRSHSAPGCIRSFFYDVAYQMPEGGIEPPRVYGPPDFESGASTNFTTPANGDCIIFSACAVKCFSKSIPEALCAIAELLHLSESKEFDCSIGRIS